MKGYQEYGEANDIITKTDRFKMLWKQGEIAKALSIVSRFRLSFTKDELRTLQIACDITHGHTKFYNQIGVDCIQKVHDAQMIINRRYGI